MKARIHGIDVDCTVAEFRRLMTTKNVEKHVRRRGRRIEPFNKGKKWCKLCKRYEVELCRRGI